MIGQQFGNYRAVSLLGEGGMGSVYLAEHPEIGRRVAVKVLRPEMVKDRQLVMRFLNEARAANAIRHPNIIEILDSGSMADGTPYLVMELLEGETLAARVRALGKVPAAEALELAYQTASALAAAHDKGIIHRDLKPDNLFLIRDPGGSGRERIKVLDFGIAKLQTFPSGGALQTRTGALIGTPVYMSPEQCLGTKQVDHRSDIYSLGVIVFEMLVGRPPFFSQGFGELVNMHLNVRPPFVTDVIPDVPVAVATLVAKALDKNPDGRQQSGTELQAEIRAAAQLVRASHGGASRGGASHGGASHGGSSSDSPSSLSASAGGTAVFSFTGGTTLSGGTGERMASPRTTAPVVRRSATRSLVAGIVAAAAVVGVGTIVLFRLSARGGTAASSVTVAGPGHAAGASAAAGHPDEPGTRPTPRASGAVHVTIESTPAGATVTDVDSGGVLGAAPVTLERAAGTAPIKVRVEKAGFVAALRDVALDQDRTVAVALDAVPTTTPPPPTTTTSGTSHARDPDKPKKPSHTHHAPAPVDDEPAKL